jgi:hypothetical protein
MKIKKPPNPLTWRLKNLFVIALGLSVTMLKLFLSIPYIFKSGMGTGIGTGMN